jgi:hopene-associated glycosyltransferase HpnB
VTPLEILALAALVFWVVLSLDRSRSWPSSLRLPEVDTTPAGGVPEVVAVVPARNEAELVGESLPTLLAQDELAAVILVDDNSADGTTDAAERVARGAGHEERLLVVPASPTPAGWAGKVHAMACGVRAVQAEPRLRECEWLLFTDADIAHRPGSVAGLLGRAREGDYDLVSIMARLRAGSAWEKLLVPTFVYFFQLLYPFRQVVRGKRAAAAGGCVLLGRESLTRAGGLESIAEAVIDDVGLARSIAAVDGRLWLGLDAGIRSLRPYPRLADLWRMVARSAYDQLGYHPALLLGTLVGLALLFAGPALLLVVAGFEASAGESASSARRALLWCALALALQVRQLLPSVRHHRLSSAWAAVLPLSSTLFGAMTLSSAWAHYSGRGVSWRGRSSRRA